MSLLSTPLIHYAHILGLHLLRRLLSYSYFFPTLLGGHQSSESLKVFERFTQDYHGIF